MPHPLLTTLSLALLEGDIEERPVVEQSPERRMLYGYCHDRTHTITINPIPSILDTLVHELLHRAHPQWTERYVRTMTTRILRALTPEEAHTLYNSYRAIRRVSRSKKPVA